MEYCFHTAASTQHFKVFGITLHTRQDDGYRSWLREDIGVDLGSSYVPYLSGHPLLVGASTALGNWLILRPLKEVYDTDVNSHGDVSKLLKDVASRQSPKFSADDAAVLSELVHLYPEK